MAEVNVRIKAQNQTRTGFQEALRDAQGFSSRASGSMRSAFSGVASDIKSSIGGALAGLASFGAIRAIMDNFGRVADLSQQFDVSAEALQRFGQVASESGSSMEQVATAFSRLTVNIQKAQGGTGAQADALRELGLSAKELAGLSPEQAFLRLADALQKSGGTNSAYAATLDLIGNRQRDLIPLLSQGSGAIAEQAAAVGAASSDIVSKVDEIGDRFGRIGQQIAVGLGPAIAFIGTAFLNVFAVVEALVTKLATGITSSVLAVGQVIQGNFSVAGEIMRGEAKETAKQWDDLKNKLKQINETPAGKPARGAAGMMDDESGAENSATAERDAQSKRRSADEAARVRQQIGEQRIANSRAGMSNEELLADLRKEERRLFKSDTSGTGEGELERLKIVGQINQIERQISERKRAEAKLGPEFGPGTADAAAGGFRVDAANFALQQREEALRIAQQQAQQQSVTGSFGASSLQRIGFASNEFFDTRRKEDPSKLMQQMVSEQKKTNKYLGDADGIYLQKS